MVSSMNYSGQHMNKSRESTNGSKVRNIFNF